MIQCQKTDKITCLGSHIKQFFVNGIAILIFREVESLNKVLSTKFGSTYKP